MLEDPEKYYRTLKETAIAISAGVVGAFTYAFLNRMNFETGNFVIDIFSHAVAVILILALFFILGYINYLLEQSAPNPQVELSKDTIHKIAVEITDYQSQHRLQEEPSKQN